MLPDLVVSIRLVCNNFVRIRKLDFFLNFFKRVKAFEIPCTKTLMFQLYSVSSLC